jgi:hypothetical protein
MTSIETTIEQIAFELAQQYGSAELEKLAKYLELLVFGKKSLEAPVAAPSTTAKAKPAKASGRTPKAVAESDDSTDDDEDNF